MKILGNSKSGMRVGKYLYNSFAYADDVSLFSATVPGLQDLINICADYSSRWRFNFGIKKTKCMVVGNRSHCFISDPQWYLNDTHIDNVSNMEILGVNFSRTVRFDEHVSTRIQKCKRSMYSLSNIGMCYPGLSTEGKVHLYKTVCLPSLMYGLEYVALCNKNLKDVQSAQGSVLKNVCGLRKRSHHNSFLKALSIEHASSYINESTKSLFTNICLTSSSTRNLCIYFMNIFITKNFLVPGTLVTRIINMGISPSSIFYSGIHKPTSTETDGLLDSLRTLLFSDNYTKPWSNEYFW